MSKIFMHAPLGASGVIHASASGLSYDIPANGVLAVDGKDVGDLMRAGYVPVTAQNNTPEADAARVRAASEAALEKHGA
jgi:hypothetical protein